MSHAGALATDRDSFVAYFVNETEGGLGAEYTFCGTLGCGGKCNMTTRGLARVSCYYEDRTPAREATIAQVTRLIDAIVYDVKGQA